MGPHSHCVPCSSLVAAQTQWRSSLARWVTLVRCWFIQILKYLYLSYFPFLIVSYMCVMEDPGNDSLNPRAFCIHSGNVKIQTWRTDESISVWMNGWQKRLSLKLYGGRWGNCLQCACDELEFDRDQATARVSLSQAYLCSLIMRFLQWHVFYASALNAQSGGSPRAICTPMQAFTFRFGHLYCAIYRAGIGSHLATFWIASGGRGFTVENITWRFLPLSPTTRSRTLLNIFVVKRDASWKGFRKFLSRKRHHAALRSALQFLSRRTYLFIKAEKFLCRKSLLCLTPSRSSRKFT